MNRTFLCFLALLAPVPFLSAEPGAPTGGTGGGPSLSLTGGCPGGVSVFVDGLTPGGTVQLAFGTGPGLSSIGGGPCAGTTLDLTSPQVLLTGTADAAGKITADIPVGETSCGNLLQVLDVATCTTSNTVQVPEPPVPGDLLAKPDGGFFLADLNEAGKASSVPLVELFWGRVVDVHDVDASGVTSPEPIFRDFIINDAIQSDGLNYLLETNPATQHTRLVILQTFQAPADGGGPTFLELLTDAGTNLAPILPKSDDPFELPPFSLLARNAALVAHFGDLLADEFTDALALESHLRVQTGYSPLIPYVSKRMIFDPNHGGLVLGESGVEFHSTRVIIDLTVSELEASKMFTPVPVNLLGLPSSDLTSSAANVSLRIPTQVDLAVGQTSVLSNLSGKPVSTAGGPFDPASSTLDVVRAMRSGNKDDPFRGFLVDLEAPQILGSFQMTVDAALDDPAGVAGFDFLINMSWPTVCRVGPQPGHIIELSGLFLEVTGVGSAPDGGSDIFNLPVRALTDTPTTPGTLLGFGLFLLPFQPGLLPGSSIGCWVHFSPTPGVIPADDVQPSSQVQVRFSEPMDPETVLPYDTFGMSRKLAPPTAHDLVPAEVLSSNDLTSFTNTPILPLTHTQGTAEAYHLWFGGRTGDFEDLVGNPIAAKPRLVTFRLDSTAPSENTGGFVLRFSKTDEVKTPAFADGAPDLRGQFLYDFPTGSIKPRPVSRYSAVVDRTQAVPGIMTLFPPGVHTPLSPLGVKMMNVWRYCDVGWASQDEQNHNVDVEGLAWAPVGGTVGSDFYPEFEMRLAHSHYLPDEHIDPTVLLPTKPASGLVAASFDANILSDPVGAQEVVHAKPLGYVVDPTDLFVATTGTLMMPYPLNKVGGPFGSYTWRDTAVQAEAGPNGNGIDLQIMADAGLIPPDAEGAIALSDQVPSIGLPLLIETRCYPNDSAVGLNRFDVSLAINTSARPTFRIFSAGGIDFLGQPVLLDPDLSLTPSGGFNPSSVPPGLPTRPDDNVVYMGQMDIVTRISRAHTVWIDTLADGLTTNFIEPVLEPLPEQQPAGTEVVVAWRGATDIVGGSGPTGAGWAFDGERIDPYGAVRNTTVAEYLGTDGQILFLDPTDATWSDGLAALDGARYLQARITFVGDVDTLANARLSALAVGFTTP